MNEFTPLIIFVIIYVSAMLLLLILGKIYSKWLSGRERQLTEPKYCGVTRVLFDKDGDPIIDVCCLNIGHGGWHQDYPYDWPPDDPNIEEKCLTCPKHDLRYNMEEINPGQFQCNDCSKKRRYR